MTDLFGSTPDVRTQAERRFGTRMVPGDGGPVLRTTRPGAQPTGYPVKREPSSERRHDPLLASDVRAQRVRNRYGAIAVLVVLQDRNQPVRK